MAEWKRARIGDLCDIVKGETGLASSTPGPYPLVATGADRRSCESWQFDTEAVCIPLVSSTGHGKKTLNYVHFQSGKFAVGTILAAVIPKDPTILTARFLHLYLSHFKDTVLVPLMKGAANVSLSMKEIASVQIPVPPLVEQQSLIDLIFHIEDEHRDLLSETNRQGELLKQLRQSVLQDAVEGKLTAAWRTQHQLTMRDPKYDAIALLEQIRKDIESRIKSGGFNNDKDLPAVKPEEISISCPKEWAFTRLGAVTNFVDYRGKTPHKIDGGVRLITAKNVKMGFLSIDPEEFISENEYSERMTRGFPQKNNIFFTTEAPLGNVCLNPLSERISVGQRIITIQPVIILPEFLTYQMMSPYFQGEVDKKKSGVTALGIKSSKLILVPLVIPPLAEQEVIVLRVDSHMAAIDQLEKQVSERKENAQILMQAVLREAFNGSVVDVMKRPPENPA